MDTSKLNVGDWVRWENPIAGGEFVIDQVKDIEYKETNKTKIPFLRLSDDWLYYAGDAKKITDEEVMLWKLSN